MKMKQNDNAMNLNFRGKFIVLDGPDGCGKTTQQKLLSEWIQQQGAQVVCFRDPGTTAIGEQIRKILLDTANAGMGDNVEVLLYMAARAQLWKEYISPALQQGQCVLMDRWLSSTCAYQGSAGGFGVEKVIHIAENALQRVWPDITLILDVDLQTAAGRMNRPLDRMEQKGAGYHQKVRQGFLELCGQYPDIIKVDASLGPDEVQQQIREAIAACFAGKKK
jgi:dTMP kinase